MFKNSVEDLILFHFFEVKSKGRNRKRLSRKDLEKLLSRQKSLKEHVATLIELGLLEDDPRKEGGLILTRSGEKRVIEIAKRLVEVFVHKNRKRRSKSLPFEEIKEKTGLGRIACKTAINELVGSNFLEFAGASSVWISKTETEKEGALQRDIVKIIVRRARANPVAAGLIVLALVMASLLGGVDDFFSIRNSINGQKAKSETKGNLEEKKPICIGTKDSTQNIYVLLTLFDPAGEEIISESVFNSVNKEKKKRHFDSLGVGYCPRKLSLEDSARAVGEEKGADLVVFGGIEGLNVGSDSIRLEVIFEPLSLEPDPELYLPVRNLEFQPVPQNTFDQFAIRNKTITKVSDHLFLLMGILLRYQKEYRRSNFYFSSWSRQHPNSTLNSVIHLLIGNNLSDLGKYSKAIGEFKLALDSNPLNVDALFNQGIAYVNTGDYKSAEIMFERALALEADYVLTMHNIGFSHYARGERDEALKIFKEVLLRILDGHAFYQHLDWYTNAVNSLEESLKEGEQVDSADEEEGGTEPPKPGDESTNITTDSSETIVEEPDLRKVKESFEVGESLLGKQLYGGAIDKFTVAIQNGIRTQEAYYNRALCYLRKGEPDFIRACQDFEKAKSWKKYDEVFDYKYARALHGAKKYEKAVYVITDQIKKDRKKGKFNPVYHELRGECSRSVKDYSGAIEDFEWMVENDKDYVVARGHHQLAQTYSLMGKSEKAVQAYFNYFDKVPSTRESKTYREALTYMALVDRTEDFYKLLELYCTNGGSFSGLSNLEGVENHVNEPRFLKTKEECRSSLMRN